MESQEEAKELLRKGLSLLKSGNAVDAVFCFEELLFISDRSPISLSCLGLAMARANLDLKAAETHCKDAITQSPRQADFYRSLAEVYEIKGDKSNAIETLKKGLKIDRTNKEMLKALKRIGVRKEPIIPFLSRSNFLNKLLGKLRAKQS